MIVIMSDWRKIFEDGTLCTLAASQVLFRRDDKISTTYLVVSGRVAMERSLTTGEPLVLAVTKTGQLLAEASLFCERYHCDAVAREPTQLLALDKSVMLQRLSSAPQTATNLLSETCREVQRLRGRIEILRLKRVSDRLSAWLEINGKPEAGKWIDIAEAIGVSPEALYRELAKRREKPAGTG